MAYMEGLISVVIPTRNRAALLGRALNSALGQTYSPLEVTMDVRRPVGDRVTSMVYEGKELEEGRTLTLCMNNYRATGTGGYPFYAKCRLVKDQPTEISQMIIEYIDRHKYVVVDKRKWLHVIY